VTSLRVVILCLIGACGRIRFDPSNEPATDADADGLDVIKNSPRNRRGRVA